METAHDDSVRRKLVLCTLRPGRVEQQRLDLLFGWDHAATWSVEGGNGAVHLSGYLSAVDTGEEFEAGAGAMAYAPPTASADTVALSHGKVSGPMWCARVGLSLHCVPSRALGCTAGIMSDVYAMPSATLPQFIDSDDSSYSPTSGGAAVTHTSSDGSSASSGDSSDTGGGRVITEERPTLRARAVAARVAATAAAPRSGGKPRTKRTLEEREARRAARARHAAAAPRKRERSPDDAGDSVGSANGAKDGGDRMNLLGYRGSGAAAAAENGGPALGGSQPRKRKRRRHKSRGMNGGARVPA